MKLNFLKISLVGLMLPCFALAQNDSFIVKGKVSASHNGEYVFLAYSAGSKTATKDSVIIKNGLFEFTGKAPVPGVGYLRIAKTTPANSADFYLANGETDIVTTDSLKDATITGNKMAEDYVRMMVPLRPILKEKMKYYSQFLALPEEDKKSPEAKALAVKIQEMNRKAISSIYTFIDQNPDSYVSLDYLEKTAGAAIDYDSIMPKFEKLSASLKNSERGKVFYGRIESAKSARVGAVAKNFESTTPDGNKLSMMQVASAGKYTLVDFWASWCGPCRAENPNVVNAYKMYHDKGLNIISVSLDNKAENWKAAIAKDGMPWNHVSSLMGWKEPAALLYGVHAIPQNVLVDSKGVVVAKNLRGDELLAKLKELFL